MATPLADLPSLAPAPMPDLPSLGSGIGLSFVSLGIVCVVAYLALRWLGRRGFTAHASGPLRVVARQSLDPKRSVFVIEAAQRYFLVGAGEGAMSLIAELDKEAVARDLAAGAAPRPNSAVKAFADVLAKVLRKPAPAESPQPEPDHAVGP
jgi:flagellar biosynthetic protein FliO